MSEFFLNERSISGQYSERQAFLNALRVVLDARRAIEQAGFRLYCDSHVRFRPAIAETTFEQVMRSSGNKELLSFVLGWLSKAGPFWAGDRLHSDDDLFVCLNDDVTGSSLAEAASRNSFETPCSMISFAPSQFTHRPIAVVWTRSAGGETDVSLDNFWELGALSSHLEACARPFTEWTQMFEWALRSCEHLIFSHDVIEDILHEPFSLAAARELQTLLRVLNEVSGCHDAASALNARGRELIELWFRGHHARFTDESDKNIEDFTSELTFKHPTSDSKVLCSWHGKVRLGRQYRIHFQWPKPAGDRLWVSYIGPKITKR
jgi:hypothetical protein